MNNADDVVRSLYIVCSLFEVRFVLSLTVFLWERNQSLYNHMGLSENVGYLPNEIAI